MIPGLLGIKVSQSQTFTEGGKRIPVTTMQVGPCSVVQIKSPTHDSYIALQLGLGIKRAKKLTKAQRGHLAKAGIGENNLPRFLREIRLRGEEIAEIHPGMFIKVSDVFKVGDNVQVTGQSKGKGFAGVVKRHHFQGGPRTHGQSDRERAPGAIGQTTTPGRVYKGKRMAGRLGMDQVTIKNLLVMNVDHDNNLLVIKGLVPGPKGSLVKIFKQN